MSINFYKPLATNYPIDERLIHKWVEEAYNGHRYMMWQHGWQKAELKDGVFYVNGEETKKTLRVLKQIFWSRTNKYKCITIDDCQYRWRGIYGKKGGEWNKYKLI
ncbi:MAG: hypothetical protein AAF039_15075 [Bacteroidota bacterium]